MKIKVDFSALNQAVKKMGAVQVNFSPPSDTPSFGSTAARLKKGIRVPLSVVIPSTAGPLEYDGEQVLLYIQDHGGKVENTLQNGKNGNKYHVSFCTALERMKTVGRFERYVITNNTSGVFHISGFKYPSKEPLEGSANLNVCKYCLSKLNYNNYNSNKGAVFKAFSLEEFFERYKPHFKKKPSRKAGKGSADGYPEDWAEISSRFRESRNWQCENCKVNLESHKSLLHTHHKSGVKSDNTLSNLEALCILCHAEQPHHQQMKKGIKAEDRKKVLDLRFTQKRT